MNTLTGTARLMRLIVRRDRIRLPVWLMSLWGVLALQVAGINEAYPGEAAKLTYATVMSSSLAARLFGAPDGPSLGAITMVEIYSMLAILFALMSTMGVVRHTRQNEETGRLELVGSATVGRHAPLAAALLCAWLTCVAFFVGAVLVLIAFGLPTGGAMLMAASLAGVGAVFAGIAAIAAQLAGGARLANGLSGMVIGIMFLISGIGSVFGDIRSDGLGVVIAWPSWLSPIGWGELAYPFTRERWAIVALYLAVAFVLAIVSFMLLDRRDHGAGMLPTRRLRPHARRSLLSPIGLAVRLQRGTWLGWCAGVLIMGVTTGAFANEIERMLADNEVAQQMFMALGNGKTLRDSYFAIMAVWIGVMLSAYVVQSLLRLHSEEESAGDELLATAIGRIPWQVSHTIVTLIGALALLVAGGVSAGITGVIVTGDSGLYVSLLVAMLVQLPALAVIAGITVCAHGLSVHHMATVGWAAVLVCVVTLMGDMFQLPDVAMKISPFAHLPLVPTEDVAWAPLFVLSAIGVGLAVAGALMWRTRDVGGSVWNALSRAR